MKKHKIHLEKKDYELVEINLPFYAYYQGENEEIFVKITDKEFKQITFHINGMVEIFKTRFQRTLAAIWYKNQTDWMHWQEAVKNAKEYVRSL